MSSQKQSLLKNAIKILCIDKTSQTVLFKDALDLWLTTNYLSNKQSTITKYKNIIETHLVPDIGNVPLNQVNAKMLNEYINFKLKKGSKKDKGPLSSSYVCTMVMIINGSIDIAKKQGYCDNLNIQISRPKIISKEPKTLSNNDFVKLKLYLFNNANLNKLAIAIPLFTGLRIGEVCALKWSDIDFEKAVLHVSSTITRSKENNKTKLVVGSPKTVTSNRHIPIPNDLLQLLYKMKSNDEYFIITNSTEFLNPRTLENRFHKILNNLEIIDTNFHALRHTFASKCVEGGMDIKSLSEILGHSNPNVTLKIYVHSSMELKRKSIEKIFE